jgi:acetyltransferase EpsM
MRIIVIGAGGHGQVVADVLLQAQANGEAWQAVGFLDDNAALHGQCFGSLLVQGGLSALPAITHEAVILGIGDNRTRQELFVRLLRQGECFVTAVHPAAVVSPFATLGLGCVLVAGAIVNPGVVIGDNVILNTGCTVAHHSQVGAHSHLAPGTRLGGQVQVGEGALIGIGATVMPQRSIGAWSTVGAGAVVVKDVPAGATVVGVPARPLIRD